MTSSSKKIQDAFSFGVSVKDERGPPFGVPVKDEGGPPF
jgi:hypothetical protein